jgi:hypothetical protein
MVATTPPDGRPDPPPVNYAPVRDPKPFPTGDPLGGSSSGTIEVLTGDTPVSLSGCAGDTLFEPGPRVRLQLDPDRPVVIGRQQDGVPEYLDPAYRTTRIVPGTGQAVVQSSRVGPDTWVSRGHFMLRGCGRGIALTNGVPRAGGGIRPPVNGTWLLRPEWRLLEPGEEYVIESGSAAVLHLPNGAVVRIAAG